MKIEIPLKGGFNSHHDPEEVGSGFTNLINFNNERDGKISKRSIIGSGYNLRNKNFSNIIHWLSPNGKYYYIGYDIRSTGSYLEKIIYRISNDFVNFEEIAR